MRAPDPEDVSLDNDAAEMAGPSKSVSSAIFRRGVVSMTYHREPAVSCWAALVLKQGEVIACLILGI